MSDPRAEREMVNTLRQFMLHKLSKNRDKVWQNSTNLSLLTRLKEEVDELEAALSSGEDSIDVCLEAADVANFAGMILDNVLAGRR